MGVGIEAITWCARSGGAARARSGGCGDPDARLRADGGRRTVVHALVDALAAAGRGCDRAGAAAGSGRPAAGRPDRARGCGGGGARRGWRAVGMAGRGSRFELARWLEHDGDGRAPAEAAKTRDFHCDAEGCAASVKGLTVAVPGNASALRDDCAKARPSWCERRPARAVARRRRPSSAHGMFSRAARTRFTLKVAACASTRLQPSVAGALGRLPMRPPQPMRLPMRSGPGAARERSDLEKS